jgi:hypothetical protein
MTMTRKELTDHYLGADPSTSRKERFQVGADIILMLA